MSLSPEIFPVLVRSLSERFKGKLCFRTEAGNGWMAMFFRPGDRCLFFSWNELNPGFCTASENEISHLKRAEKRSFPFGDILLKHIVRFSLVSIERVASDRIILLHFSRLIGAGIDTSRTLIAELTGRRNNLHLIRDDGTIMESARPNKNFDNSIIANRPGKPFSLPPVFAGVDPIKRCDPGLFFSLEMLSGFGRALGSRLKDNWHLFPHQVWMSYFREMHDSSNPETIHEPFLQSIDSLLSAFPVPIGNALFLEGDILDLMREHIIIPLLANHDRSTKQDLLKKIEKRSLKLASIRKGLESQITQSQKAIEYKEAGDLLLSNACRVPKGADSVTLPQWTENGFSDIAIRLDPSISISQNAQNYFRKYKKFNVKRSIIAEKMDKLSMEESNIRALAEMILITEDPDALAEIAEEIYSVARVGSKRSTHGPVKIFEFGGFQIMAGTNSKSNRKVTFVFASGDDLWFHARGVPGGHVIIKNRSGLDRENSVMEFAASLAAHFSKYGEAEKIDVDFTRRKYVRAVPGTLAEVTYSHARTITVSPLLWGRMLSENRQAQEAEQTGSS